jgi:predicted membrane-bound spermidine synthase
LSSFIVTQCHAFLLLLSLSFNAGGVVVGIFLSQIAELFDIQTLWLVVGGTGLLMSLVSIKENFAFIRSNIVHRAC